VTSNPSQEERIEELEELVSRLTTIATYAYIAFLSIPRRFRDEDLDFDKSIERISSELDAIYKYLKKPSGTEK
jgi:hypothetical protein